MIPKPGIYPLVPFAEYASWDAINPSFLATLAHKTPHHAKQDKDHPKPETDDKRVGRALHSYILEPATFDQFWMVLPEDPPRRPSDRQRSAKDPSAETVKAIEFWDAIRAAGKDTVKASEFALIEAMANEVRRQQCVTLISGGRAEVSIVWEDAETGLLCKSRLDYERSSSIDWNHYITDLKSSRDIAPRRFANDIASFGYALAAAMRIDGWRTLANEDSIYNLLAVDKGYCVAWLKQIGDKTIEAGRDDYRNALRLAAECMEKDEWPAYGTDVDFIEAPEWYLQLHGIGRDRIVEQPQAPVNYTVGADAEPDDEFDAFMDAK